MRYFLILLGLAFGLNASAQKFLKSKPGRALSFKEMQLQFNDWKQHTDLKTAKHWKFFKRWEMDMQLHTNGKGEPGDAATYIKALTEVAQQKQQSPNNSFSSAAWYPVGPSVIPVNETGYMENGIGRINCIAFHPSNANTYFVGVAQGGVWKTVNNGGTWTPLTDNLPITRVSDICMDPNNANTMYISLCDFEYIGFGLFLNGRKRNTHYGLGVYKTTDGGSTWNPTGLSFLLTNGDASLIRKVLVNPANSNELVACGVSGMYRSTNAGASWTKTVDSLFWDLVMDPVSPNILYAATGWVANANDGGCGIYKSTNFGATWTLLSNTGIPETGTVQRIKLGVAPSDHNYVYAIAVDNSSGLHGIYKSTNAGSTWNFIDPGVNILEWDDGSSNGGQGTYDLGFLISATDRNKLYVGGVNVWGSSDGGNTWNPASHWTLEYGPTLHGDIHFIERQPLTGNIFVCSDGGVYRTTNIITQTWSAANSGTPWPTQWTNIGNGMAVTSFYRISSTKNSAGHLIGGAQDNASFYYDGSIWSTIIGGDGMDNYLDPLDNDFLIGSSQYGNFNYSDDGGQTTNWMDPNVNFENAEWTTPIIADYNNPGRLYAGFTNVVKSTNNGMSWTAISNFPVGNYDNEISALAVSNSNAQVIYAAKRVRYEYNERAKLYKTTNGGGNWTNVTPGLPDSLYYTSVEISASDANTVYVTMAGFSAGNKVYRTTNGGTSWQNISYNLPNIPVNVIKYIPGMPGAVMIGTDVGVYILYSSATSWTLASTGLPNTIVSDIEFNVPLNKVYVSTFGRGIWASDLSGITQVNSLAENNSSHIELFPGLNNGSFTIRLSDASEKLNLEIINIEGRIVSSSTLAGQTEYHQELALPAGMYFARVTGSKISGVKSFVVQ
jgi:photosystem II stability/assembly factor-like uncharacterized protein